MSRSVSLQSPEDGVGRKIIIIHNELKKDKTCKRRYDHSPGYSLKHYSFIHAYMHYSCILFIHSFIDSFIHSGLAGGLPSPKGDLQPPVYHNSSGSYTKSLAKL